MRTKTAQDGFSLIELLVVVVIIGIVAAMSVPAYQRAVRAAENGVVFSTMRTIAQTQVSYFSQNSRFGRLIEINNQNGGNLGTPVGTDLQRNNFTFTMVPAAPTDTELKQGYTITATRNIATDPVVYKYQVSEDGYIRQILP